MLATLAFAVLAGGLSILSPCVLPLLPIVFAAANGEARFGGFALAGGLALSFAASGLFVATIGHAAGLDADAMRVFGAVLMLGFAAILAIPRLQEAAVAGLAPVGGFVAARIEGRAMQGFGGQFALGAALGLAWAPCVGPTLGAASLMAARGQNLGEVTATMAAFGIGAGIPLLAIGALPAARLSAAKARLQSAGRGGKLLLATLLAIAGVLVLTGLDKRVEAALLDLWPEWLMLLSMRF
ncbi:cytochrome c biogenesis protein CcdA [Halotia wernerae UHCC 0503]|jgi:cytochrome c-type biogenesis protein|nr:cytochrome c biogenesis protein CcdA [Halotia wernerae UHCC 0503]